MDQLASPAGAQDSGASEASWLAFLYHPVCGCSQVSFYKPASNELEKAMLGSPTADKAALAPNLAGVESSRHSHSVAPGAPKPRGPPNPKGVVAHLDSGGSNDSGHAGHGKKGPSSPQAARGGGRDPIPAAAVSIQDASASIDQYAAGSRQIIDDDNRSIRSSAHSEGTCSVLKYMDYLSEPRTPSEVKKMVKEFVRQMVKGRDMGVLTGTGSIKPVTCGLTRTLDVLRIKFGEQTRKVRIADIKRAVHGAAEDLQDLQTPLDETCSTLELETSDCITFKFPEKKAAELFTLCMQVFVDGQKH